MTPKLIMMYQDQIAGELARLKGGELQLRYEDRYRFEAIATPLSTGISLAESDHKGARLANWLWGLLPDSEPVLNRWARTFSVSTASPFGLLSTPVGEDCAGAFSFLQPERVDEVLNGKGGVEWLSESDIATLLRELRSDVTSWLGTEPPGRFSLSGAQAKTALLWDGTQWGRPSGSVATTHILKPALSGLDDHDLNEHLCLSAARLSGLLVVDTAIQHFEDQDALVIRRYDRIVRDQEQIRVHQEDLCQALGIHPSNKYQNEGGPSVKSIAEFMHLVMPLRVADDSIERITDALIWNWIIAGPDAHAKNYSLLLSGQDVRLAPLYDMASALPYKDIPEKKIQLAMKFGSDYSLDVRPSAWPILARDLGISEDSLRSRAGQLVATAPDSFSSAAKQADVKQESSTFPSRLVDAVAKRAARCATALAGN
jgi:serine/threonine-protein kinase HipA